MGCFASLASHWYYVAGTAGVLIAAIVGLAVNTHIVERHRARKWPGQRSRA